MAEQAPVSISMDLSKHSTTVPVICDGRIVKVRIANITQSANEKGQLLKFEYHLLEPAPTTEGKQVNAGFPIFENITLYGGDTPPGQIPEFAMTKISKRIDAALGTGDEGNKKGRPARPAFNGELVPVLIGKELYLQVKAKTGDYEGNDITKVFNPADVPAA